MNHSREAYFMNRLLFLSQKVNSVDILKKFYEVVKKSLETALCLKSDCLPIVHVIIMVVQED